MLMAFVFRTAACFAQLTVSPISPQSAVGGYIVGAGVSFNSVQFQGQSAQLGLVTGGTVMGLDTAIVLSTGMVTQLANPFGFTASSAMNGTGTDSDILGLMQQANSGATSAQDIASLSFQFIPNGDSLTLEFVFGSEEYPEFVCSFNDGMGIFLSGPGINGPFTNQAINLATIPGSNVPVSISTINQTNDNCPQANQNSNLYVNNIAIGGTQICLDGYTKVLRTFRGLTCGATYRLKLVVADCNDKSYDSVLFLKAKSLRTNLPTYSVSFIPSSRPEDCGPGTLRVNRFGNLSGTTTVNIGYTGTATVGVDCTTLPTQVTFNPGQSFQNFPFTIPNDGVSEGLETLTATVSFPACTGTQTASANFQIKDQVPLSGPLIVPDTLSICEENGFIILTNITTANYPISYLWSNGQTVPNLFQVATLAMNQTYVSVVVTNGCVPTTLKDSVYILVSPSNATTITANLDLQYEMCLLPETVSVSLANPPAQASQIVLTITGNMTSGQDYVPFNDTLNLVPGVTNYTIPITFLADGVSEGQESISISIEDGPGQNCIFTTSSCIITVTDSVVPPITPGADAFQICAGDTVALSANFIRPENTLSYYWMPGNITGSTYFFSGLLTDSIPVYLYVTDTVCALPRVTIDTMYIYPPNSGSLELVGPLDQMVPCKGTVISLAPEVSGGAGSISYSWFNNSGSLISNSSNVVFTVNNSFSVLLVASDQCGARDSLVVDIQQPPSQPMSLISPVDTIATCPNQSMAVYVQVQGGMPGFSYTWSNGLALDTFQVVVNQPLSFMVTVRDTCNQTLRHYVNLVPVSNYVYPSVALSGDSTLCLNETLVFQAAASGGKLGYQYAFSSASGQPLQVSGTQVTAAWPETDLLRVTLTDACQNQALDEVEVIRKSDCNPAFYNIITPNGDGINDNFVVGNIEEYPGTALEIWDRWGNRIYQNGSYDNSFSLQAQGKDTGVYYYLVTFGPNFSGDNRTQSGFFQLFK